MTDSFPKLSADGLKQLFIHQLNRINCAKTYLIKHLPELKEIASFHALKMAIEEDLHDVKKQFTRVIEIYAILKSAPSEDGCAVLKCVIDEALKLGDKAGKTTIMNDMDIILFLQLVEHVEMTTYRMLKMIAEFLGDNKIEQLMMECFDETIDNDKLFVLISEEYLAKKLSAA